MMPGVETHWPAPAKLNLFLHVTGRRADGYHELQTLFQLIDLADTVTIAVREDGLIERPVGPAGVDPETDLSVRAARALSSRSRERRIWTIAEPVYPAVARRGAESARHHAR